MRHPQRFVLGLAVWAAAALAVLTGASAEVSVGPLSVDVNTQDTDPDDGYDEKIEVELEVEDATEAEAYAYDWNGCPPSHPFRPTSDFRPKLTVEESHVGEHEAEVNYGYEYCCNKPGLYPLVIRLQGGTCIIR